MSQDLNTHSKLKGLIDQSVRTLFAITALLGLAVSTGCGKVVDGILGNVSDVIATTNQQGTIEAPGAASKDYLRAEPYNELMIEIITVEGMIPTQATLDTFKAFIGRYLNKPAGITLYMNPRVIARGSVPIWSANKLLEVENQFRAYRTGGSLAVASFLFVDGVYEEDTATSKTLGVAYAPSSMAIFTETVRAAMGSAPAFRQSIAMASVLAHEFGHLMGLVDGGAPMQHAHHDLNNPGHCTQTSCLMNYLVNTTRGLSNIQADGSVIPPFDSHCVADIVAGGGRDGTAN